MKKVKKFGRGGDILTGLGAGLMGYALYKKLKGEGEDKDDKRPAKKEPEVSITEPREKERSAEEKRALATSKGRPELFPEGTTDADRATMYSDNYPTPKPKPKPAAKDVKVKPASQTFPVDNDALNRRRLEGLSKSKPAPSGTKGTQDVGKALGISSGAKGTQTLGDRIKGTVESAGKSVVRTPAERMAEAARQVEERRKREAEGMKKGGKVKKYNSGGTATSKPEPKKDTMPEWAKNERANKKQDELNKRESEGAKKEVKRNMSTFGFKNGGTASRRADGIAQRGKTRGRIC
jgi:hypothetical protein